jgi:hypothetical protein
MVNFLLQVLDFGLLGHLAVFGSLLEPHLEFVFRHHFIRYKPQFELLSKI